MSSFPSTAAKAASITPPSTPAYGGCRRRDVRTRLLLGLVSLIVVATLASCLPPRAAVSHTPRPEAAATPEPTSTASTEEPAFSYEPPPEQSVEPPVAESFATYAVTKPDIRDRAFDWDLQITPSFDAYDAATTSSALKAAARDILSTSNDQERWFVGHMDYDPIYKVPMTMWRDAVGGLSSGAANVVRGLDRGDQPLIRKRKRAIKAARETMSSTAFLGAWGPLIIH